MTRLAWDTVGERVYETGVDHGVLYVDGVGFAWPGLVSVEESPSGGEPRPYYIDGFKYLNVAGAEEFEATIEAFSSPPEFARCDGIDELHTGLFASQQPRKSFGFSYRTKVGNDVDGLDHGYKIHLVYGALSAPSGRTYSTVGDSGDVPTQSWEITTLPPRIAGFKPTAHFVVDSRSTPKGLMAEIQNALYGTALSTPHLPTVLELLGMFQSQGPEVARNVLFDPAFRVNVTNWNPLGSTVLSHANPGLRLVTGTSGADAAFGYGAYANPHPVNNLPANTPMMWRLRLNSLADTTVTIWPRLNGQETTSQSFNLLAGVPQECVVEATISSEITTAHVIVGTASTGVEFTLETIYIGVAVDRYFDGSSPSENGYFFSWLGAVNASASVMNSWHYIDPSVDYDAGIVGESQFELIDGGAP